MIELMELAMEMSKDIQYLKAYIEALKNTKGKKLSEDWLDNQEVLLTLHISPRTLQSYRDNGTLPFSKICSFMSHVSMCVYKLVYMIFF